MLMTSCILLALAVWIGFGLLLLIGGKAKAEQPVRIVVTLTCEDVQALVAWKGWQVIESRARAAGATAAQIEAVKRCAAGH
jgi:hypothetical protein